MGITAKFVDAVDEDLLCTLCFKPYDKPVTRCTQGHTYCKPCITRYISLGPDAFVSSSSSSASSARRASTSPDPSPSPAHASPHCPGCLLPLVGLDWIGWLILQA